MTGVQTCALPISNDTNLQYNPLTGNGDLAGGQNATGNYHLVLRSLSLWHNASNPYDVDGDSTASPLDVLTIVNYLNLVGSGPVSARRPPPYLDVDNDNFVSPLDALVVINFLNSQSNGQGEGERVSASVPMEFIDDYFSNLTRKVGANTTQKNRLSSWPGR